MRLRFSRLCPGKQPQHLLVSFPRRGAAGGEEKANHRRSGTRPCATTTPASERGSGAPARRWAAQSARRGLRGEEPRADACAGADGESLRRDESSPGRKRRNPSKGQGTGAGGGEAAVRSPEAKKPKGRCGQANHRRSGTRPCRTRGARAEGATGPHGEDAARRRQGQGSEEKSPAPAYWAARPDERACATTGTARASEAPLSEGRWRLGGTSEAAVGRQSATQQPGRRKPQRRNLPRRGAGRRDGQARHRRGGTRPEDRMRRARGRGERGKRQPGGLSGAAGSEPSESCETSRAKRSKRALRCLSMRYEGPNAGIAAHREDGEGPEESSPVPPPSAGRAREPPARESTPVAGAVYGSALALAERTSRRWGEGRTANNQAGKDRSAGRATAEEPPATKEPRAVAGARPGKRAGRVGPTKPQFRRGRAVPAEKNQHQRSRPTKAGFARPELTGGFDIVSCYFYLYPFTRNLHTHAALSGASSCSAFSV